MTVIERWLEAARARGLRLSTGLGLVGIAVLFVALRWNSFDAPLTRDEGEYAYAAWLLRHGIAPYQHAFLQKPPMVVYSYLLGQLLGPTVDWLPRVVAYVFVALCTGLVGVIARREFGRGSALTAMWLVTPMFLLPQIKQFTANTEMFLVLPLLGVTATYALTRGQASSRHWLAAGFLAGLTLLYKYTMAPVLAVLFAAWSYDQWHAHRTPRTLTARWLAACAGAFAATAATLAYFVARDGGWSLWDCTVRFNRHYAGSGQFDIGAMSRHLAFFGSAWWVAFVLPFALIPKAPRRIWFWLSMLAVAVASSLGSRYSHYFVPAMPFWALVCTAAIDAIVERTAERARDWVRRGIVTAVVALLCLPDLPLLSLSRTEFRAATYRFQDYPAAANQIARITAPHERIFIAGSEPQIAYAARRRNASRFVLMYPLMIPSALALEYQRETIRDLTENPPAAIVLARAPQSWLEQPESPKEILAFLANLLRTEYRPVGGYVAELGAWKTPLSRSEIENSELLLFRRKRDPAGVPAAPRERP